MIARNVFRAAFTALLAGALSLAAPAGSQEVSWPDLSKPAPAVGGGSRDAAVVVGIEDYFAVPGVPGAKENARSWFEYLTETRGIPVQNVKLLLNDDATREGVLDAARQAAAAAGNDGALWFVFIGHGAPSSDGKDGLLVGVDAQQKAQSLQTRSVRRSELLKMLGSTPGRSIRVVLDACFSGRGPDGASLAPGLQPLVAVGTMGAVDPRAVVLTAARGDQFAGALPGAQRPAFSYLVLGGLRGWAADKDGKITAGSLFRYAQNALAATLHGRDQTPDLIGSADAPMGRSPGEAGPSLVKLAEAAAGAGRPAQTSRVSAAPAAAAKPATVPSAAAPRAIETPARTKPRGGSVDLTTDSDGLSKATVVIATSKGVVRLKLYPKDAPNTVRRFVELAQEGFYDGLTFHRVVPGFVVQGGDPRGNGTGGSGQALKAEFNARKHVMGAVAMARAQDPDSADSQFYITLGPQPFLDGHYTVFGQVVEGMDVVRSIQVGDRMTTVTLE